jgi:hypothetical protein
MVDFAGAPNPVAPPVLCIVSMQSWLTFTHSSHVDWNLTQWSRKGCKSVSGQVADFFAVLIRIYWLDPDPILSELVLWLFVSWLMFFNLQKSTLNVQVKRKTFQLIHKYYLILLCEILIGLLRRIIYGTVPFILGLCLPSGHFPLGNFP